MDFIAPRYAFASICERLVPLIPSRPAAPAAGCIAFDFNPERSLRAIATDGMGVFVIHHVPPEVIGEPEGDCTPGSALVPAHTLWDRIRAIPVPEMADDTIRLDARNPARVGLHSYEGLSYAFPSMDVQHLFDVPRPDGNAHMLAGGAKVFADALHRASYAMGSEGSDPRARMLAVREGRVFAYSSFGRAQEVRIAGLSEESDLLIPDGVLTPLLRWLRSFPVDTPVFLRSAALGPADGARQAYVVISILDGEGFVPSFAFPVPAAEFVDLGPVWRRAEEQAAGAGTLLIHSWEKFVALLRAARLAAPPAAPVARLLISGSASQSGPVLVAATDDANNFESPIGATYTGPDPEREIAFSIDDMIEMLASLAYTEETSATLSIAPASVAVGGVRPFIQLVPAEGSDYRAVITQLDA